MSVLVFPLPIIVLLQFNQLNSLYSVAQKIYKYQGLCLPKKELFKIKKALMFQMNGTGQNTYNNTFGQIIRCPLVSYMNKMLEEDPETIIPPLNF